MMQLRTTRLATALLACTIIAGCTQAPPQDDNATQAEERQNILLIVADDMGYTDLGVYGGEIPTPNIDTLAKDGIILTDFHNQAVCAPTRAALLSGTDDHNAGGTMHRLPNQDGVPGYENHLSFDVMTFPKMLQQAGYKTYWTGKWHLGSEEGMRPVDRGFDRAFTLISSGASHWEDMRGMFARERKGHYSRDGVDVTSLPEGFYSTAYYTDTLMEYIDSNKETGEPWFGFLGYTAPHWPLHAPDETIAKYKGQYDVGYDVIRAQRIERAKGLGIIPQDANTYPRLAAVPPWESLTEAQQAESARIMEVYAAMIDQIDQNVGRMVSYLKETGQYENTLIMFISDNGAEGANRDPGDNGTDWTFDNSLDNIGRPGSHVYYGAGWAQAGSGVSRYYKSFASEGGIRGPAILHHPNLTKKGVISDAMSTVMDIAPTALSLASIDAPRTVNGKPVQELQGQSLTPLAFGDANEVHSAETVFGWEILGHFAVRKGDWKLLRLASTGSDPGQRNIESSDYWGLYNMSNDPGEVNDLSDENPDIKAMLLEEWEGYLARNNMVLPDLSSRRGPPVPGADSSEPVEAGGH